MHPFEDSLNGAATIFDIADVTIQTGAFDDQFTLHDEGDFTFDAGSGLNQITADNNALGNDTKFDWKVQANRLSSRDESVSLVGFGGTATLIGGDAGNKIEAVSWPGPVNIDGRGGSDQFRVNLGGLTRADVMEASENGSNDQLIAVGTPQDDVIFINGTAINIGTRAANFAGIESVRAAGGTNVSITVRNVAATPIREGETTFVTGVIDDPGHRDILTVQIDWGNGNQTTENVSPGPFSFARRFLDDDSSDSSRDEIPIEITVIDYLRFVFDLSGHHP